MIFSLWGSWCNSKLCTMTNYREGLLTFCECVSHSSGHPWELLVMEGFGGEAHFSFHNSPFHIDLVTKLNGIHGQQAFDLSASTSNCIRKLVRSSSRYTSPTSEHSCNIDRMTSVVLTRMRWTLGATFVKYLHYWHNSRYHLQHFLKSHMAFPHCLPSPSDSLHACASNPFQVQWRI